MDDNKKITKLLRKAGRKEPQLLLARFQNTDLTDLELAIMKHRYIDGLGFKLIPYCDDVCISENWMYKVHKKALEKTIYKLELLEYLALFVK